MPSFDAAGAPALDDSGHAADLEPERSRRHERSIGSEGRPVDRASEPGLSTSRLDGDDLHAKAVVEGFTVPGAHRSTGARPSALHRRVSARLLGAIECVTGELGELDPRSRERDRSEASNGHLVRIERAAGHGAALDEGAGLPIDGGGDLLVADLLGVQVWRAAELQGATEGIEQLGFAGERAIAILGARDSRSTGSPRTLTTQPSALPQDRPGTQRRELDGA